MSNINVDEVSEERSVAEVEISTLADKLVQARKRLVESYEQGGLSREDALAKVQESSTAFVDHLLEQPLRSTSFGNLDEIAASNPQAAIERWHAMINEAGDQLESGHTAADAVEAPDDCCWQRAQFMALREELCNGWEPRNGIERQLIDMMAQSLTIKNFWLHKMVVLDALDSPIASDEKFAPPRVSTHQAVDQGATMADRFDRMFMRTLRQLRDLRRYMPTIVVQNAGQVNIGEQQVNVGETNPIKGSIPGA